MLALWQLTVPERGVVWVTRPSLEFTPYEISSERLKLETSNFVHGLATRSTNIRRIYLLLRTVPKYCRQVAQLWQRDRASSINDFRWGVKLRLNYTIEGLLFAPLRHDAIYAYASYGKQIISSTRPSCWIQISTVDQRVDAINVAADYQMFMTLTGELSW